MAICQRTLIVTLVLTVVGMMSSACFGQVNASCVVSILNRNVQVNANGTWVIPNIPANFGPVRARTTCVENGVTRSGQSDFFTIPTNGSVDIPRIVLGSATPIPNQVTVNATTSNLTKAGQTAQLNVVGKYADGGSKNLTSASTGTQYLVSNPALGTITTDGLVTATQSGTLLIQAINEGTQGLLQINIALSGDTDGDGIPDDVELRLGMNPNNPADAQEDPDHDGLTNLQEYRLGTDMRDPDSDGDGLSDGQEVKFGTNPLLSDTDGDGVPDGIEVATGSNPRDPNSTNLPKALKKITVSPNAFTINIDSTTGTGSQQLSVTGEFNAGGTIDLTPRTRGTNYSSSNLSVCNFGAESGKVFGAADGTCTITVSNSGFTATVAGTVRNFTPTALSFIDIPGFANNVDVNGNFAYVAAGSAGLQVVNVTDRAKPQIVASRKTPGNANDVVVAGNFAYVADGSSGLQIINIANPVAPVIVGSVATAGDASDVVVYDNLAFVANGAGGLVIIDVSSRTAPKIVGSLALPGPAKGVDAEVGRGIAVVAAGVFGLYVIDISNRTAPKLISSLAGGDVRDVAIRGNFAYLAEISRGFTSVDLSNLFAPFITASTPPNTGGRLMDVVLAGQFALGADVNFVNGVPVISLANPAAPSPRAIIDFRSFRDDNGTGIAADGNYVYMTAEQGSFGTDNGVNGTTRLYIGQYSSREDKAGILPRITLTAPQNNVSVIRGTNVNIRANATDDIGVESVIFSANGVDVGSDSSEPYETLYLVPVNATVLSIRARAVDFGGNVAQSGTVTVTTIADPLTIARGRAVDVNNVAVSGAQVTCQGKTAITDAAGGFQITGLSTIAGDIFCSATASVSGVRFFGASQGFVPAVAGVTNIGSFTLRGPGKTKIVGGSEHTCGLNAQGGVKCWGSNRFGQLGDGTFSDSLVAKDVPGLTIGVIDISSGRLHTCAVLGSGIVKCWGNNNNGEFGDGTKTSKNVPTAVLGLTDAMQVASGGSHTCAVTNSGAVKCWGNGFWGQLGDGKFDGSTTPVDVLGIGGIVVSVSAGGFTNCAVLLSAETKCWGDFRNGPAHPGDSTPKVVLGLTGGVISVSVGTAHLCALLRSGGAKCWGDNSRGQLGDGTVFNSDSPVDVFGLTHGVISIEAKYDSACAITTSGAAKCWGQNSGGNNGFSAGNKPVEPIGLTSSVATVAVGSVQSCAALDSGIAKCWGLNSNGEVGDGTRNTTFTPKTVVGF